MYIFAQILLAMVMLSMGYNIIMIITEVLGRSPWAPCCIDFTLLVYKKNVKCISKLEG